MLSKEKIEDILGEFKELKSKRELWTQLWQDVGRYIHGTKLNFQEEYMSGDNLGRNRYENTGIYASTTLASSLIGILWGNSGRSVKLVPSLGISGSEENKLFYERITDTLVEALDDPRAGLEVALSEYLLDQVCFGTSGLGIFESDTGGLRFESWSIVNLYIAENEYNRVETVYKLHRLTLRQLISTYGLNQLSSELQNLAKSPIHLSDKFEVLQCIKKRLDYNPDLKGSLEMPYMSVHLEKKNAHVLKESGFNEMPIKVARFKKFAYEEYGRSPGTDALSDVKEMEFLRRIFSTGCHKSISPPTFVFDDGRFGGGIINMSADAINVLDVSSGRFNNDKSPIQSMNTVGDLNAPLIRMEQLKQNITQFFFLDKLLDFNNSSTMTATEVLMRDLIKKYSIGSVISRQISETFDPLVTRCFNILFMNGRLGVLRGSDQEAEMLTRGIEPIYIPDEIAMRMVNGLPIYEIRYFSPASQTHRSQEAETLNNLVAFKLNLQQGTPEIEDAFNADAALRLAAEIGGIPQIMRSDEEIAMVRMQRRQQEMMQQASDMGEQAARTGRDASQAGLI